MNQHNNCIDENTFNLQSILYNGLCIKVQIFENECHKYEMFASFNYVWYFGHVVIRYSLVFPYLTENHFIYVGKKWQDEIEFNIGCLFGFICVAISKLYSSSKSNTRNWTFTENKHKYYFINIWVSTAYLCYVFQFVLLYKCLFFLN